MIWFGNLRTLLSLSRRPVLSQSWQPQYNPGNQPPMTHHPPGPPGFGAPLPVPGQFPIQPSYPYAAPYGPQPNSGNPVGAFFLGLFVSVVIALLYSLIMYATYQDQPKNAAQTIYVIHALLNGAVVGAVVGLVGRRSVGAQISGAFVAMLGAFFGYANAVVLIYTDVGGLSAFSDMIRFDPFMPATVWWGSQSGAGLISLLGLLAAAVAAWGLAFVIGRRR
jgi:hypothetical protein